MGVSDIELLATLTNTVVKNVKNDEIIIEKGDKNKNQLSDALSGCETSLKKTTTNNIVAKNININKKDVEKAASNNKANNGKFDLAECFKNFGKGLISPAIAIIEHPFISLGAILGTAVICNIIPVAGVALAVGFGAYSIYEITKGSYNAVKNYQTGKYDDSEKSFEEIGQGTTGLLLSLSGLKQGAKVAQEAKIMNELKLPGLTIEQQQEIANAINTAAKFNAIKEILSLFTTKSGIKATLNEFRPSIMKKRVPISWDSYFKKSKEHISRKSMSDDEIIPKVEAEFNKIIDKANIPQDKRPKLVINNSLKDLNASYNQKLNIIEFSVEQYRNGSNDIAESLMHEIIHFKEAILRAGIPQKRADEIIKETLIKRIIDGENPKIAVNYDADLMKYTIMEPPKLSSSLKQDFIEFAQTYLYKTNPSVDRNTLQVLLKKHPEFIQCYKTEEEALNILELYAVSHANRFTILRNNDIGEHSIKMLLSCDDVADPVYVSELKDSQLILAEESLRAKIDLFEGNVAQAYIKASDKGYSQYLFATEEVLAERQGQEYLIEKTLQDLEELKKVGQLTKGKEEYLLSVIDRAKMNIKYRIKGKEFFEQYRKMLNNPDNKKQKADVDTLWKELLSLNPTIQPMMSRISKYQRLLLPLALIGEASE